MFYIGKEKDEETGLGYHSARYYAGWLGRWVSADPGGMVDGVNRYQYSSGSPVGRLDGNGYAGQEAEPSLLSMLWGGIQILRVSLGGERPKSAEEKKEEARQSTMDYIHAHEGALVGHGIVDLQPWQVEMYVNGPAGGHTISEAAFMRMPMEASATNIGGALASPGGYDRARFGTAVGDAAIMSGVGLSARSRPVGPAAPYRFAESAVPQSSLNNVVRGPAGVSEPSSWAKGNAVDVRSTETYKASKGRGYVSGFSEISAKARLAAGGTSAKRLQAAAEIRAAKHFRDTGVNVHFQTPGAVRSNTGGTADLLVGGERGTGVGGAAWDVVSPTSGNPNAVFRAVRNKNNQTPNVVLDLSNTSVTADQLGDVMARLQGSKATNIQQVLILP